MKQLIGNFLQLRHIPVSHWPLVWHLLLATGTCVLVALLGLVGVYQITLQNQYLLVQHAELEGELLSLRAVGGSTVLPDVTQSFPTPKHTDDVVRDIGRFAEEVGVQVSNLSVSTLPSSPTQLGRVQFNIAAMGSYKSTKAWLSELLARYTSLAITGLSIQRSQSDPLQQDVHLILVWYVQAD